MEAGVERASVTPESGWARDYAFPADHQTICLSYEGDTQYAYDLDGRFVDRSRWIAAGLAKGDVYLIQRLMTQAGEMPEPSEQASWI